MRQWEFISVQAETVNCQGDTSALHGDGDRFVYVIKQRRVLGSSPSGEEERWAMGSVAVCPTLWNAGEL